MTGAKYIGMDVHKGDISIAVMNFVGVSRLPKRIDAHMEEMWREAADRHGAFSSHLWPMRVPVSTPIETIVRHGTDSILSNWYSSAGGR